MEPPTKKVKVVADPDDAKSQPVTDDQAQPKPTERSKPASKNALGVGEIRNMIYKELLQAVPNDLALETTSVTLNYTTGDIHESKTGIHDVLNVVPRSGRSGLFEMSLVNVPQAFHEFLSESAHKITFAFTTAESLDNFSELFNTYSTALPQLLVPINVTIHLFRGGEFESMEAWEEIGMAHGYSEGARRHVKEFVDAVQTLPSNIKVSFVLEYPWRDYRSLRGVTNPLRARNDSHTVEVLVLKDRWNAVPDVAFHLGMTVAALEGGQVWARQSQLTEDEARELVKYGCRGLRHA